jgi:hypothetical protein
MVVVIQAALARGWERPDLPRCPADWRLDVVLTSPQRLLGLRFDPGCDSLAAWVTEVARRVACGHGRDRPRAARSPCVPNWQPSLRTPFPDRTPSVRSSPFATGLKPPLQNIGNYTHRWRSPADGITLHPITRANPRENQKPSLTTRSRPGLQDSQKPDEDQKTLHRQNSAVRLEAHGRGRPQVIDANGQTARGSYTR